ncbi:enoyl-CoA hydratase/isomerase family protein [Sphingosinicellaceae bacterium]|nr:enoyl-CoA hydratase/isomerase family protein [Sphingosinicellaceae bacterium]
MEFWNTTTDERGIVLARYRNPPMNYFCAGGAAELLELIDGWKSPQVRAVILTGTGDKFLTHYSVEELAALSADTAELTRIGTALSDGHHDMLRAMQSLPKPIIAAISGDCMGGGLELALWCDLRVAQAGDYRIGLPEVLMGILPGGSGTQMVSRMLGAAAAIRLVLLGELFTPEQAVAAGLVHFVADDCVEKAMDIAEFLCSKNPAAIAQIKDAIHIGAHLPLKDGLAREATAFVAVMKSPQASQIMNTYLAVEFDKRRGWLDEQKL